MIKVNKISIKKRIKSDKVIYAIIAYFLVCTLLILNPYIIKATSIEATVENSIKLPSISSNLYEVNKDMNNIQSKLYSQKGLSANLQTESFSNVKIDDEYTIKYEVNLPDLLQRVMGKYDEVVIAIDSSSHMYGEKWAEVKDFFVNNFASSLGSRDIKIGFVAFEGATIIQPNIGNGNNTDFNSLFDMSDEENINKIINIFKEDYITAHQYNGNRSIDTALVKASELLDEGFSQNKSQAIIIITSGSFDIWTQQNFDAFVKQQHDVITVDIHDGKEQSAPFSAVKVHEMLGGEMSNFLTADMNSDLDITNKLSQAIKSVTTVPFVQSISSRQTEISNLSHIKANNFDEVVLAIDASSHMYIKKWDTVKEFFKNYFQYSSVLENLKLGIIPYNNDVVSPNGDYNDTFNSLLDIEKKENVSKIQDVFGQNYLYANQYNGQRAIFPILNAAKELFTNDSNRKAIIFLTSGDYDVYNQNQLDLFKALGYRVITISISENQLSDKGNAKDIHTKLGGADADYITADVSSSPTVVETLCDIFGVIKSDEVLPGEGILDKLNVELRFNLGNYIEACEGLELVDGEYVYSINDMSYSLEDERFIFNPIDIEFMIRIKEVDAAFTFESANIVYQYRDCSPVVQSIAKPVFTMEGDGELIPAVNNSIKILEIQPTDKFSLTKNIQAATTGTEKLIEKIDGVSWNVQVDHITMPEFIGKIDQLNGKYDIVVIGQDDGKYSGPFKNNPLNIHNGNYSGTVYSPNNLNPNTQVEYYSENDITDKRAKEILSLINSGQLVFINQSVFDLKDTKLYKNFSSLLVSNFIRYDQIDIAQIINSYKTLSEELKRPILNIFKSPLGDINNSQGDINSRKLGFGFEIYGLPNEQIEVSLYLDINGDGLFRESDEELRTPNEFSVITLNDEGYARLSESEFYYTMPSDFIGHLSWKLVIQRANDNYSSDILNYQIGTIQLNRLPQQEKVLIKVLQVVPGCEKNENNIYKCGLNANTYFNDLIQNLDYDIDLDVVNIDKFNKLKLDNNDSLILDNYDMIIIGFADSYANKSMSATAIDALKKFIETGQSVMFTHDTMSYAYRDENVGRLTREFRSVLGQARFEPIAEYNSTSPVQLKDQIIYDSLSKSDSIYSSGRWTMGYTKAHLIRFANGKSAGVAYAGEVYQINEGQITDYPFELSEQDLNQNDGKITIPVAKTHYQYYQLNLEQENLVPWYSLSGKYNASAGHAPYDPYDVRNNYYTYSIGNLTYSGTGHDSVLGNYKEAEIKLFINTIVKAIRGANKAPTFDVFNLTNEMEFFDQQPTLDFSITPYDLDKDKMNITVTVKDSSGNIRGELKYRDRKDNENFEVSIPKEYYADSTMITIEINVEDEHGAQAIPQTFLVNITNDERLKVQFISSSPGYLVGDTIEMQAIFTKEDLNNGYRFSNFNVIVDETDADRILEKQSEEIVPDAIVDKDDNQLINKYYYTVGESILIPSDPTYSKSINLQAQYEYIKSHFNGSKAENDVIEGKITGSLNVREGVVTVKFIDENDRPISNVAPRISLVSEDNQYEGQVDLKTGSVTFRNIPTGAYTLVVEQIPGYNFGTYYEVINNEKVQLSSTLSVSYENNNRMVYVSLSDPSIKHGLYQGFSQGTVLIDENEQTLQTTSIVQFASSFNLNNRLDSNISLAIDETIELLENDRVKVYQVIDNKMKEIHEVELSSHTITFNLNEKLQEAETYEIVVLYKGKLTQPEKQYINRVKVNKVSKEAVVRSTSTTELPDLF